MVPEWEFPVDFGEYGNLESYQFAAAQDWAEKEKIKNRAIGEARAIQELAFRDAIISQKEEKVGKKEKFFWITVNPSKDVDLPLLRSTVEKIYSKKWIKSFAYVFENTSNNHIHSHGLIRADYQAARARVEIGNTIKHICLISNPHCFKFVILTEEQAKEKLAYMMGQKKSEKLADVELTKKWREDNNILPIYTNEGLLSC